MQKLSKEQMEVALRKHILQCTEDEIRFVFHIVNFDLKEFHQEVGRVQFEIHFTRFYVIKVTITQEMLVFSNEWMVFNDQNSHALDAIATPPMLFMVMNRFIQTFAQILQEMQWRPVYIDGYSVFEDGKTAKEYFELFQQTANKISKEIEALRPKEEKEAPKNVLKVKKTPAKKNTAGRGGAKGKVVKLPVAGGKKKLLN